ncbi:MAG: isoprenoid biosynthesis glyoxalase ElbB [Deltaproteobacteria bacterium]|nr:isoprenoid biosynthesis glyoxalase ElbB [Deltaproteobacteria bacterium]
MAARVAVVLSGCGYLDGAEIHESVLTLYFLERAGAEIRCFAPDKKQMHVVDHLTGEPTGETRNVLVESARIARGQIKDIKQARMAELDALVLPGGFGVAKNLSEFAVKGTAGELDADLVRLVGEAAAQNKPIVAICISPAVLAVALQRSGKSATLTIGNDKATADAVRGTGCTHAECPVDQAIVDEKNKIISTPAYMLGPGPKAVGAGIERAILKLMSWLQR